MAQPRINRSERAYRHLTEEILRGRWQPGDTVSTYALAKELQISRTPVLEALKRLESDGLVEIIPQVGSRIVGPTEGGIEDLLSVRGALEGLAATAAARRIDEEGLSELGSTLHQLEAAARRGDRAAYEELDERFHLRIAEASAVPRLLQSARSVWAPLRQQLARLPVRDDDLAESVPEQRELYEALRRRAPQRARAAAERHARLSAVRLAARREDGRTNGLVHSALLYSKEEEFLAATVPFVEAGLDGDERVLAVTTAHNAEGLARALGPRAEEVEFRNSGEWYQLPSHTLLSYERYIEHADRARVRIIGEVAWGGETRAPMSEWTRYESILNIAFALEPVSIMCPYDARELPKRIVADAGRTHPRVSTGAGTAPSANYVDSQALIRELDRERLEEPRAPFVEQPITADLRSTRDFILERAHTAGVTGKALEDTFLAVQEAAANVSADGPGRGVIRAWVQDGELVYEVRDDGSGTGDPLVTSLASDPALISGPRGLWLARLLCDLVEVRSEENRRIVRLHVALAG